MKLGIGPNRALQTYTGRHCTKRERKMAVGRKASEQAIR
jgi:hypothetical protein